MTDSDCFDWSGWSALVGRRRTLLGRCRHARPPVCARCSAQTLVASRECADAPLWRCLKCSTPEERDDRPASAGRRREGRRQGRCPEISGDGRPPCAALMDVAINDLLGLHVPMDGRVPRAGGRPVKSGTVYDPGPEELAFGRWQQGVSQERSCVDCGLLIGIRSV